MIKIIKVQICLIFFAAVGCRDTKKPHTETTKIIISGKPINVYYSYRGTQGSLLIKYSGNLRGKVGVCYINSSNEHPATKFESNCPWVDTLSGDLTKFQSRAGYEREMDAEEVRCLRFVPESTEVTGEINILFQESLQGAF